MKTKMIFLFILSSGLVSLAALQAEASSTLEKRVENAQDQCPRLNCPDQSVWVVALPGAEQKQLTQDQKAQMKADVQALTDDLWPRLIQDLSLKRLNRLRIDKLEKLEVDGKMVGYRISYSDKAWNMDGCSDIDQCETGRIYESAFISADLSDYFVDRQASAAYRPDPKAKTSPVVGSP